MARLRRSASPIFNDPSAGMEYNKFHTNRKVSRMIYDVDIARTPHIVKESKGTRNRFLFIDVNDDIHKVNSERSYLDNQDHKFRGRS